VFRWSETAGLKQVVRSRNLSNSEALNLIDMDYQVELEGQVA